MVNISFDDNRNVKVLELSSTVEKCINNILEENENDGFLDKVNELINDPEIGIKSRS